MAERSRNRKRLEQNREAQRRFRQKSSMREKRSEHELQLLLTTKNALEKELNELCQEGESLVQQVLSPRQDDDLSLSSTIQLQSWESEQNQVTNIESPSMPISSGWNQPQLLSTTLLKDDVSLDMGYTMNPQQNDALVETPDPVLDQSGQQTLPFVDLDMSAPTAPLMNGFMPSFCADPNTYNNLQTWPYDGMGHTNGLIPYPTIAHQPMEIQVRLIYPSVAIGFCLPISDMGMYPIQQEYPIMAV